MPYAEGETTVKNTTKPVRLLSNSTVWGLEKMNKMYESGSIVGFQAQLQLNDGTFVTMRCGTLSYIEKLGLLEAAKAHVVDEVGKI